MDLGTGDRGAEDRTAVLLARAFVRCTRPFGEPFAEKLVMSPDRMAWARALVDRLGG